MTDWENSQAAACQRCLFLFFDPLARLGKPQLEPQPSRWAMPLPALAISRSPQAEEDLSCDTANLRMPKFWTLWSVVLPMNQYASLNLGDYPKWDCTYNCTGHAQSWRRFLTSRRKVRSEETFTMPTQDETVGNLSEEKAGHLGKGDRLYDDAGWREHCEGWHTVEGIFRYRKSWNDRTGTV